MKKISFIFAIALLLLSSTVFASHFRGGKIEWTRSANSNTVIFKVTSVWREDFTEDIIINFGDNQTAIVTGTLVQQINGYKVFEGTITHTYANSGTFYASYGSCCRIAGTQNSSSGDNFTVGSLVCLNSNNNSSPNTTDPFLIELTLGSLNQLQLNGSDADGSPLTFSASSITAPNYIPSVGVNTLAISPSGLLTWNTSGTLLNQL